MFNFLFILLTLLAQQQQPRPIMVCLYGLQWVDEIGSVRIHTETYEPARTVIKDGAIYIGCRYDPTFIGAMRVPDESTTTTQSDNRNQQNKNDN